MKIEKNMVFAEAEKPLEEKKPNVKVSVIIPVYNVENYLSGCLESIISQTYKNLEIICIDDGSTDHSMGILEFYKKKDRRIKVFQQKNAGPSAARNRGLNEATGKYISFVDADDYLSNNGYEILTLVAEKYDLDLLIFGGNIFPEARSEEWIDRILNTQYAYYKKCDGCSLAFTEKSSRPFLWLHFLKREILENPNRIRFDESMELGEDQLFQFEYLPRVKSAMVIEDKIYNYRVDRNGSLMQLYGAKKVQKMECHMELVKKVSDIWKKEGYREAAEDRLVSWIVNFLYYSIVDFPITFKQRYAEKILKLIEEQGFHTYLLAEYEQGLYRKLKEFAITQIDEAVEIETLKKCIEQDKYEINETLNSRAFKVGRALTKKSERMDLLKFEQV